MLSKCVLRVLPSSRSRMYSEHWIYDRKTMLACSDRWRVREFRLQERFLFNVKAEMFLAWFTGLIQFHCRRSFRAVPCNRAVNISRCASGRRHSQPFVPGWNHPFLFKSLCYRLPLFFIFLSTPYPPLESFFLPQARGKEREETRDTSFFLSLFLSTVKWKQRSNAVLSDVINLPAG